MATLLVLLAVLCLMNGVQSQPDSDVCTFHGPSVGPTLPVLPEQYMLRVEANIRGWNHTIEVVEFYDGMSNRGAVTNIWKGSVSQTVVSYTTEEIFHVGSDGSCRVQNLTANGFNIYGFEIVNGTAHIGNINDIFRFGAQYNETYMGKTYIRGIPANHWQSCLYQERRGSTSLLDYYFTVPGYSGSFGDAEVPLRLELNGRAPNHEFIHGKLVPTNGTHNFSHVYEFFDVQFHPEFPDRTFEPRIGVLCPGRKSPKPFPVIPDHFSVSWEIVAPDSNHVIYTRQAYNYKSKMNAAYYTVSDTSNTPIKYHLLDDFNTGLTYRINLNNGSCKISPIYLESRDAILSPDNAHVQIRDVSDLLYLGIHDWQYQGVTKLREIDTESWIAKKLNYSSENSPPTDVTVEFFFTTAAWNTESGLQNSSNMPVMAKYRWNEKKNGTEEKANITIVNFFHFEATTLSTSHFDISPCFSTDDSKELAFDIADDGVYSQYILNNTIEFYHGAQNSIAKVAGVTPIRVAALFVTKGSDGVTTLFFKLLGIPWVEGDSDNMTSQTPLGEAYINLENAMNLGELQLGFKHRGKDVFVSPQPKSLRTEFTPSDDQPLGFSMGTFIGFGVGMFVLGGLLCACIVFVVRKKFGEVSVPYNVQS